MDVRQSARRLALGLVNQRFRAPTWLGLVAFAAVFIRIVTAPGLIGLLGAGLALVMLAIAVIDFRSFTIPNTLNAVGFGLAIAHATAQQPDDMLTAVVMAALRGIAFALVLLAIRIVYARLRGRPGLGLGDVKLAAVAGGWLDWALMPIALELAAFAALSWYLTRNLYFVARSRQSTECRLVCFWRLRFGFAGFFKRSGRSYSQSAPKLN